jgi:hypothetical protein
VRREASSAKRTLTLHDTYTHSQVRIQADTAIKTFILDRNFPGSSSFSQEPPARVIIEGLLGSLTPSNVLSVVGPSAHLLVNSSCVWNQTQGTLVLEFAPGMGLEVLQEATWSWELRNSGKASTPANATVRITGAITLPQDTERQTLVGSVLHAAVPPAFDMLFINYTSAVIGGRSKITIMFQPNAILEGLQV